MATIANLKVNLLADSTGLNRSLADATAKMQAFGDKMSNIGATMSTRLTLPIVGIGVSMVKAASDAEETATKFAVVFRDVEQGATQAFKTLRDEYGLSTAASKELLGNTGDLLTGFGFSQQAALELSTEVNKLAVDLASFTNFSGGAKGASDALTKALLGERESVKSLGISILEEDVQKQVAINTTKGLTFATDRQAKAYATLQIAQAQSKNAIGDYERTQDGLANQTRLLQQRMNDLAVSFGEIMVPAVNKIVERLTVMTEGLRDMNPETKSIILGIAGFVAIAGPVAFAVGKLTLAMKSLTLAMAANPYTAMAVALLAIGTAAYMAFDGISDVTKKIRENLGLQDMLTGSQEEYNKILAEQNKIRNQIKPIDDQLAEEDLSPGQIQALMQTKAEYVKNQEAVKGLAREWYAARDAGIELKKATDDLEKGLENSTGEIVHAAGSTDALGAQLKDLQAQMGATGDAVKRAQLAHQIRGITSEIERLERMTDPVEEVAIGIQKLSTASFARGQLPLAQLPQHIIDMNNELRETALLTEVMDFSINLAKDSMMQFTNLAIQGFADLVVNGGKVIDMLRNIGKMVLSGAIQMLLKYGLFGAAGFGIKDGSTGLVGKLFGASVMGGDMGTVTPASASLTLDGQFQIRGTDLVYVMNRAERSLR
jgi:hypothetical protein